MFNVPHIHRILLIVVGLITSAVLLGLIFILNGSETPISPPLQSPSPAPVTCLAQNGNACPPCKREIYRVPPVFPPSERQSLRAIRDKAHISVSAILLGNVGSRHVWSVLNGRFIRSLHVSVDSVAQRDALKSKFSFFIAECSRWLNVSVGLMEDLGPESAELIVLIGNGVDAAAKLMLAHQDRATRHAVVVSSSSGMPGADTGGSDGPAEPLVDALRRRGAQIDAVGFHHRARTNGMAWTVDSVTYGATCSVQLRRFYEPETPLRHRLHHQYLFKQQQWALHQGVDVPDDMSLFMPTLFDYASRSDAIAEFGVRSVGSTWSLLAGAPYEYMGVDPSPITGIDGIRGAQELMRTHQMPEGFARFVNASDLEIPPLHEQFDMLFVDSLHTGRQVKAELERHGMRVRRWLVFHDAAMCYEPEHTAGCGPKDEGSMGPEWEAWTARHSEWKWVVRDWRLFGLLVFERQYPGGSEPFSCRQYSRGQMEVLLRP